MSEEIFLVGKKFDGRVLQRVQDMHSELRTWVQEVCTQEWCVTGIRQETESAYQPTLATLQDEQPEYILSEVKIYVIVTLVERVPVEKLLNGVLVHLPLTTLECRLDLMSDGLLQVTDIRQGKQRGWVMR